jgi:hypothetical protein
MTRRIPFLVTAALAACAVPDDGPDPAICERAADHMEACLPGFAVAREATECTGYEAQRSEWLLSLTCDQVLLQSADGKADGVPALRGIRIRREGNRTYFMIPLAQTAGGDRRALLDETVRKFTERMGELNTAMIERGIDLSSLLTGAPAQEFADNYVGTMDRLFASDLDDRLATELGETIAEPEQLSTWDRYVIPQAFFAYFSAKFGVNIIVGGGVSATAMIVAQPWLSLAVDHTAAQPTVVARNMELDVAILGAPNIDIGGGVGGGIPLRIGVGAVFGPVDEPSDIAGWGIGLSGSFTVPIVGGAQGKFISVLKAPPLFMLMLGYSTGTAAELEIHGNLQKLLDLEEFLAWISSLDLIPGNN